MPLGSILGVDLLTCAKGGKCMYAKGMILGIALTLSLPAVSVAQSRPDSNVVEDIDTSAIADGSIVLISKEETDVPGYVHTKYAYVDRFCGVQLVDHYGAPVDPNDSELKLAESRMCSQIGFNSGDGE
jgi:hypothetical protein